MAKRTRARKRATGAPTKKRAYKHAHLPVSRRYTYTVELLAEMRRRYEQTDDSILDLAAECGIHPTTFQRMANREHWVRFQPPPRDLSPAAKLAAEAEALASSLPPPERGRSPAGAERRQAGGDPSAPEVTPEVTPTLTLPLSGGGNGEAAPDPVDRLLLAVEKELTTVEAMRARMQSEPQRPADADVTARTLARLSATLRELRHMRRAQTPFPSQPGYDDDDFPADLDAFRDELARRIDAFVASRTDAGAAGDDPAAPDDAALS